MAALGVGLCEVWLGKKTWRGSRVIYIGFKVQLLTSINCDISLL